MKQLIKILLVFVFSLLLTSCSEEFLAPKPLSFFAPENVYIDKEGFEAGLVTVRKDLKNDFYGPMANNNLELEYATSDFGFGIGMSDYTVITPSSGTFLPILPMFERIYSYIKNANVIISRIDDIVWDKETDRNAILGQALFFRSWWYYRLITSYGDVPFIGIELKGAKLDFYTHSRWTILEKLIEDLEFAVEWLPETTKAGVPNKYAALHFLSKLYLANCEFDKAIDAATTVIEGPYDLMTERFGSDANNMEKNVLWDLHRPENKSLPNNKEAILTVIDRSEAPIGAKSAGSYTMRAFHTPWWYQFVLDSEGKRGTIDSGEQYKLLGRANCDVFQSYWFSYEIWDDGIHNWRNTPDLRRSDANWWEVNEILYNNPSSVDYGKPVNPAYCASISDTIMFWPMPFHKTYFPHEPDYKGQPMGGNGDRYVFRLAETYLIRAEAFFWKNQLNRAADDINEIRKRANASLISPADVNIDFIFDERLRELAIEEFRHSEMVRVANIMAKLNVNGYSLTDLSQHNWWYDRLMNYNTWYKKIKSYHGSFTNYIFNVEPRYIYWPIQTSYIATNTKGVINQNEGFEGAENNIPPLTEIGDDISYDYRK